MPAKRKRQVATIGTSLLSLVVACSSRADDDISTSQHSGLRTPTSTPETISLVAESVVVTTPRSVDGSDRCSLVSVEDIASLVGPDATVAAVPDATACTFTGRGAGVVINAPDGPWSIVDVAAKYQEGKQAEVAGNTAWELSDPRFAECVVYVSLAMSPLPLVLQVTAEGSAPSTGGELCPVARSVAEAAVMALPPA